MHETNPAGPCGLRIALRCRDRGMIEDALAESATIVEETLQGITSVKSYANEKYEIGRYNSALLKTGDR